MKKLIILLSITHLFACTKQGPIGKTGASGANGAQGLTGNNGANGSTVIVKNFTNVMSKCNVDDTLHIPEITQGIIDTGSVFMQASRIWHGNFSHTIIRFLHPVKLFSNRNVFPV